MTSKKPTFWTDDGNGPTGLRILVGSGGAAVTPKEGMVLQRQYVAWLQEIKSKKPLQEAEAVLT